MITNNSIGQAKEEEEAKNNEGRSLPFTSSLSSSRQWSSFRNPRIVRVSRSFGGKDRHSKVCTVRGLRDRRIRLSVQTAVELYDLQDKLGLNQPSKVVDWLLDVTKEDIDKLPPLQIPPGFGQFLHHHQQQQVFGPATSRNLIGDLLLPYESNPYQFPTNTNSLLSKQGLRINDDGRFWDMESGGLRTKSNKQVMKNDDEKGKSIELQKVSAAAQSFFRYSPSTLPIPPYSNSYNHYENSNLSLSSQFGGQLLQPQVENFFNPINSITTFPSSSSLALPSGLYLCPTTLPSLFPTSYLMPPSNEAADHTRQVMNHFQLLNNAAAAAAGPSSQTSTMPASRFFQANVMNSKYLHHLHHNHQTQSDKYVDN